MTSCLRILLCVGGLLAAGVLGWALRPLSESAKAHPAPGGQAATERKVLYWYDPMQPQTHFDHPGPSPLMPSMQLVPKYADEGAPGATGIRVDPRMAQNLGLRVAAVERGDFARRLHTVGLVAIDQHFVHALTARAEGWVERLNVRALGEPVRRGQPVVAIYAPQLLASQEELLLARQRGDAALLAAARRRLALLGAPSGFIAALEKEGRTRRDVPVVSPVDGVLSELKVREGDPVSAGMALALVADLSKVWIEVQVPEAQAAWFALGDPATVTLPALPGERYVAKVDYVYPDLQAATRTLRMRLVIDNPRLELKPGMYARVALDAAPLRGVLTVPDEAVIRDGRRERVMLAEPGGRYRPQPVRLGDDDGSRRVVLEGLNEGDQVVISGQFLIDAEANLTGALQRLEPSNLDRAGKNGPEPPPAQKDMKDMPDMALPAAPQSPETPR
jgi:Cu(I)/Ag(I) efflux system membrane fusion protein